MATSAGEVEVKLSLVVDEFNKALAKSQQSVQSANDAMLNSVQRFAAGIAGAFTASKIISFLSDSLDAFGENQQAVAGLTNALQNQGIASRALVTSLTEQATRLQQLTGVSDETIISAQTLLTTFGLQGEVLNKTVLAALDLAATRHMDLNQAALLLGKAFVGETGSLGRFGIAVSQSLDPSKKFAAVLDQISGSMSGRAIENAKTYSGQVAILKATFNDLQEAIGKMLSGPAGTFVKWLVDAALRLTQFVTDIGNAKNVLSGFAIFLGSTVITVLESFGHTLITLVIGPLNALISSLPVVGAAFQKNAMSVGQLNALLAQGATGMRTFLAISLAGSKQIQSALVNNTKAAFDSEAAIAKFQTDRRMLNADELQKQLKDYTHYYEELEKATVDFYNSFIESEAEMWGFATSMSDTFFQGVGDSLAQTVIEGKSFGAAMKNIFRSMAESIISYVVQIIAKMLVLLALESATGTGPAGGAFVSSFAGFAADGGVIGEPSLITGLRSGRSMIAGEAGPEYIVPSKNQTAGQAGLDFGGGGGSGSVVINISGQFLEADENAWGRLMREKILPEIRRSTMISPTGNFNRRRGVA